MDAMNSKVGHLVDGTPAPSRAVEFFEAELAGFLDVRFGRECPVVHSSAPLPRATGGSSSLAVRPPGIEASLYTRRWDPEGEMAGLGALIIPDLGDHTGSLGVHRIAQASASPHFIHQ